jgi:hypothetical protein
VSGPSGGVKLGDLDSRDACQFATTACKWRRKPCLEVQLARIATIAYVALHAARTRLPRADTVEEVLSRVRGGMPGRAGLDAASASARHHTAQQWHVEPALVSTRGEERAHFEASSRFRTAFAWYRIAPPSRRGTEAVTTAPIRNRLRALRPYVGSNPTLSARPERARNYRAVLFAEQGGYQHRPSVGATKTVRIRF